MLVTRFKYCSRTLGIAKFEAIRFKEVLFQILKSLNYTGYSFLHWLINGKYLSGVLEELLTGLQSHDGVTPFTFNYLLHL